MWIERRGLILLGGASLLLNVFLVGIVLGHVFAADRRTDAPRAGGPAVQGGAGGPGGVGMIAGARVKSLSPDQRDVFMQAMAPHRRAIRLAREAHRGVRQTIEADIASPTYDRDKIAADFEALRHTNDAIGREVDAALLDALTSLSPDGRAALIEHPAVAPPRAP